MNQSAQWTIAGLGTLLLGGLALSLLPRQHVGHLFTASQSTPAEAPAVVRPAERPPPLPGNDSSVSAEPLRLILVSTAPESRTAAATARIGTDERNPQTYRVGSILANGARLAEIGPDFVLLERDGRIHKLARGAPAHPNVLTAGSIDSVGGDVPQKIAATIESAESVTEVIRPRPVFDDAGAFIAYELQPGTDAAGFARLGLRAGDRLVAVNGTALASTQEAAAALRLLSAGTGIDATLVRNGVTLRSTLDGADLTAANAAATGR